MLMKPPDSTLIQEVPFQPSTIENIDRAVFEYVRDELALHAVSNRGFKKVPVIWISAERAYQTKRAENAPTDDAMLRDSLGALILPVITIERKSVVKNPTRKGAAWANVPESRDYRGGSITVARRIQQDKTANFANADSFKAGGNRNARKQVNFKTRRNNQKVVYQTITMPMPVYVDITYSILLKTEYQEQMNQLITPLITKPGGVNYIPIRRDGHFYEAFMRSDFSQNNNISTLNEEERRYETKVDLEVLGYLIGEDTNEDRPKHVIRENAVQLRIPRERIVTGDVPIHAHGDFFGLAGVAAHAPRQISTPIIKVGGLGAGSTGTAGGDVTVKDEGTDLTTKVNSINFVGPNVTATTSANDVTVTITTGSSAPSVVVKEEGVNVATALESLNFVGTGVTATASGNDVTITVVTGAAGGDITTGNFKTNIVSNTTYREVPSETANGSTTVFTTSNDMITGSLLVFVNGMLMRDGASFDYQTTSATQVTFTSPPDADSYILFNYVKD